MAAENLQQRKTVPTIARIVITQATRHRAQGAITDAVFEEQIRRVEREELEPKGLSLVVRELPAGRTRFLIKENSTGVVCDMMDFDSDGVPQRD